MSCVSPMTAYWRDVNRSAITFDKNKSATKVPFNLPCGKCIGCRMDRARQWGFRCLHEKKMWTHNHFVTLTYNDESLPPGGSLCLRDVQLFMKRLRKARNSNVGNPIRFFLGAEYGEINRRPHYHALLFNCDFPDKLFHSKNDRGEALYTSGELSRLWSNDGGRSSLGFVTIGEITFDSAIYCAKYALKKYNLRENHTQEEKDEYDRRYVVYDADGVVYERRPEFAVMSRRPGIGAGYYEKYGNEVLAHDNIIVDGRECRPPRFYDTRSELRDPDRFELIKKRRKRLGVLSRFDNTEERLRVKKRLMEIAAEKKEKKL